MSKNEERGGPWKVPVEIFLQIDSAPLIPCFSSVMCMQITWEFR